MAGLETLGAGLLSFADAWYTNRQNQKNAHQQMDFQKYMYQNRYQMQTADMMAAGLNPMLAYNQSPGSAPQGSSAQAQKSDAPRIMNDSRIASAQEANISSDTEKKRAETDNIDVDTYIKLGMPDLIAAQVNQAKQSAEQSKAMIEQIRATIPKIDAEIENLKQKTRTDSSNMELNKALTDAQWFKNGLVMAETVLTNQRAEETKQNVQIGHPKAEAAKWWSAEAGERGRNMWNLFSPFK